MTMKYAQQITVKTKKVSGMVVVALSPCAIMSCRPVRNLEQRQQYERTPHAGRLALNAALDHLCTLFLSGNGLHDSGNARKGDRVAVLDERILVHRAGRLP